MNQATELSNLKKTFKSREDELSKQIQEMQEKMKEMEQSMQEKEQRYQQEAVVLKKTLTEREHQIENLILASTEFQEMLHDAPPIEEDNSVEGNDDSVSLHKRVMTNAVKKLKTYKREESTSTESEPITPREIEDKTDAPLPLISEEGETPVPKESGLKKNIMALKTKSFLKEQFKDMKDSVKDMKDQM